MTNYELMQKAVDDYANNEDLEAGDEKIREDVRTLEQYKAALNYCRVKYPEFLTDLVTALC